MIFSNISQFKTLHNKELKEAFCDKRAMLSNVSVMMICSTISSVTGVAE